MIEVSQFVFPSTDHLLAALFVDSLRWFPRPGSTMGEVREPFQAAYNIAVRQLTNSQREPTSVLQVLDQVLIYLVDTNPMVTM